LGDPSPRDDVRARQCSTTDVPEVVPEVADEAAHLNEQLALLV
jgi:hypothetical protein